MELTEKYLAEQEDCIKRCQEGRNNWRKSKVVKERHKILKNFCKGAETILSVGSAGLEPIELNATHAIDVHKLAYDYLIEGGWKGVFVVASCDEIPYQSRFFDVAVCQEVIEHLPDLEEVKKTFLELHRVAKNWIVTTPAIKVAEKTHKRVFDFDMLISTTHEVPCKIERKGRYWYVSHSSD